jgi:thioredoxin-dependent peroxiredoxin
MANVLLKGNPVQTSGNLPEVGSALPPFDLTGADLADVDAPGGKRLVLSIFPSVDTGVCAAGVRRFNAAAAGLPNTVVVTASQDLPFALGRFCGAEGISDVVTASAFRSNFGEDFGVTMVDGPLRGLFARAVIVADADGKVLHSQLCGEVTEEPDYDAALSVLG